MTPKEMCEKIFELCKEYGYKNVETTILSILEMAKEHFESEE